MKLRWFVIAIVCIWIGFLVLGCGNIVNTQRTEPISDPEFCDSRTGLVNDIVTDDEKAEIIREILKPLSRKDHSVSYDGKLYLLLSEDVFQKLPSTINTIPLVRIDASDVTESFNNDYVVFDSWAKSGDLIVLKDMAYFWGGNTGGCIRRFRYTNGTWVQTTPECFAAAS